MDPDFSAIERIRDLPPDEPYGHEDESEFWEPDEDELLPDEDVT